MLLKESTALISGGASGLGWATANLFLAMGAKVAIIDLDKPENQDKIAGLGDQAAFFPADITKSDQVESALAQIQESLGSIRVNVNCAGVGSAGKILQKEKPHDLELFRFTLEVNLLGTFNVCRLAAAAMSQTNPNEQGERGVIINTASIAAFEGQAGQVAYAASKGGIVAMTLPMARDLASLGIRVMGIAPGIFDTPMLALLPEKVRQSLGEQVPFPPRLGDPSEFAKLAAHIVENSMLNGENIRLDGALRMGRQ